MAIDLGSPRTWSPEPSFDVDQFAVDLSRWKPELHPRDSKGRFRDKWGLTPAAVKYVEQLLARFNPPPFRSNEHAASHLKRRKKPRSKKQQEALDYFLSREGNEDIQSSLRAGMDPGKPVGPTAQVRELDQMMAPLEDDLILSRVIGPDAFGLPPENIAGVEEWSGQRIMDLGYSPMNLGDAYPVGGPHVEMRILVPRGTRAIIVGDDGPNARTVILDREQPVQLGTIRSDGRGGWYATATVSPRVAGRGTPPPRGIAGRELPAAQRAEAVVPTPEAFERRGMVPEEGVPAPEEAPGRLGEVTPAPPPTPTQAAPEAPAVGPTRVAPTVPAVKKIAPAKAIQEAGGEVPEGAGRVTREGEVSRPRERITPPPSRQVIPETEARAADIERQNAARQKMLDERQARLDRAEAVQRQAQERLLKRQEDDNTRLREENEQLRREQEARALPQVTPEQQEQRRVQRLDQIISRDEKFRRDIPAYPRNAEEDRISEDADAIRVQRGLEPLSTPEQVAARDQRRRERAAAESITRAGRRPPAKEAAARAKAERELTPQQQRAREQRRVQAREIMQRRTEDTILDIADRAERDPESIPDEEERNAIIARAREIRAARVEAPTPARRAPAKRAPARAVETAEAAERARQLKQAQAINRALDADRVSLPEAKGMLRDANVRKLAGGDRASIADDLRENARDLRANNNDDDANELDTMADEIDTAIGRKPAKKVAAKRAAPAKKERPESIASLRRRAKEAGIPGYTRMDQDQLRVGLAERERRPGESDQEYADRIAGLKAAPRVTKAPAAKKAVPAKAAPTEAIPQAAPGTAAGKLTATRLTPGTKILVEPGPNGWRPTNRKTGSTAIEIRSAEAVDVGGRRRIHIVGTDDEGNEIVVVPSVSPSQTFIVAPAKKAAPEKPVIKKAAAPEKPIVTKAAKKAAPVKAPFHADDVAERISRVPNVAAVRAELEDLNLAQLRKVATALRMPLPPRGTDVNTSAETLRPHIAKTTIADRALTPTPELPPPGKRAMTLFEARRFTALDALRKNPISGEGDEDYAEIVRRVDVGDWTAANAREAALKAERSMQERATAAIDARDGKRADHFSEQAGRYSRLADALVESRSTLATDPYVSGRKKPGEGAPIRGEGPRPPSKVVPESVMEERRQRRAATKKAVPGAREGRVIQIPEGRVAKKAAPAKKTAPIKKAVPAAPVKKAAPEKPVVKRAGAGVKAASVKRVPVPKEEFTKGGPKHLDIRQIGKGIDLRTEDSILDDAQADLDEGKSPSVVAKSIDFIARRISDSAAIRYGGWQRRADTDPEHAAEMRRNHERFMARATWLRELADRLSKTRRPTIRKAAPVKKAVPEKPVIKRAGAKKAVPELPVPTKKAPAKKAGPPPSADKDRVKSVARTWTLEEARRDWHGFKNSNDPQVGDDALIQHRGQIRQGVVTRVDPDGRVHVDYTTEAAIKANPNDPKISRASEMQNAMFTRRAGGPQPLSKEAARKLAESRARRKVANELRAASSEEERISILARDSSLTSPKLRQLAEELEIDVPPNMRAKSALQLHIAERMTPAKKAAPAKPVIKKAAPAAKKAVPAKKTAPGPSLKQLAEESGIPGDAGGLISSRQLDLDQGLSRPEVATRIRRDADTLEKSPLDQSSSDPNINAAARRERAESVAKLREWADRVEGKRIAKKAAPAKPVIRRAGPVGGIDRIRRNIIKAKTPEDRNKVLDDLGPLNKAQWRQVAKDLGVRGMGRSEAPDIRRAILAHFEGAGDEEAVARLADVPSVGSLDDEVRAAGVDLDKPDTRWYHGASSIKKVLVDGDNDDPESLRRRANRLNSQARTERDLAGMVEANRTDQPDRVAALRQAAHEMDLAADVLSERAFDIDARLAKKAVPAKKAAALEKPRVTKRTPKRQDLTPDTVPPPAVSTVDESEPLKSDPEGDNSIMHGDSATMNLAQALARRNRNGTANRVMQLRFDMSRNGGELDAPQRALDELKRMRDTETDPVIRRQFDDAISKIDAPQTPVPDLPKSTPPEARRLIEDLNRIPLARRSGSRSMASGHMEGDSAVEELAQFFRDVDAGKYREGRASAADEKLRSILHKYHEMEDGAYRMWDLESRTGVQRNPRTGRAEMSPLDVQLRAWVRGDRSQSGETSTSSPDVTPAAGLPPASRSRTQGDVDQRTSQDRARQRLEAREKQDRIGKADGAADLAKDLFGIAQAQRSEPGTGDLERVRRSQDFGRILRQRLEGATPGDVSNPRDSKAQGWDSLKKALAKRQDEINSPEDLDRVLREEMAKRGFIVNGDLGQNMSFNPATMATFDDKLVPGDDVVIIQPGLTFRDRDGVSVELSPPLVRRLRSQEGEQRGPLVEPAGAPRPIPPGDNPFADVPLPTWEERKAATRGDAGIDLLRDFKTEPTLRTEKALLRADALTRRMRTYELQSMASRLGLVDYKGDKQDVLRNKVMRELRRRVGVSEPESQTDREALEKLTVDELIRRLPPGVKPGPASKKADLIELLVGDGPRRDLHVEESPGTAALRQSFDSGTTDQRYFGGGSMGQVALVEGGDGREMVRKRMATDWFMAGERQADAEQLMSELGLRIGAPQPAIYRPHDRTVYMDRVPGKLAGRHSQEEIDAAIRTPEGRRIAILDAITGNSDRHNENWMIVDGKPVGIDNSLTFTDDDKVAARGPDGEILPGGTHTDDPFKAYYQYRTSVIDETVGIRLTVGGEWTDSHPFSRQELQSVRKELMAMKPQFKKLNRENWYNETLERLDALIKRARPGEGGRPIGATGSAKVVGRAAAPRAGRIERLLFPSTVRARGLATKPAALRNGVLTGITDDGELAGLLPDDTWPRGVSVRDLTVSEGYRIGEGSAFKRNGITYVIEHGQGPEERARVQQVMNDVLTHRESLPREAQAFQRSYTVVSGGNPQDAYWAARYKAVPDTFISAASAANGQTIIWNGGSQHEPELLRSFLDHEFGHNVSHQAPHLGDQSPQWRRATQTDNPILRGGFTPIDAHATRGLVNPDRSSSFPRGVTAYGSADISEDYAESIRLYLMGTLGVGAFTEGDSFEPIWFRDLFPARAAVLDQIMPQFSRQQVAEIQRVRALPPTARTRAVPPMRLAAPS